MRSSAGSDSRGRPPADFIPARRGPPMMQSRTLPLAASACLLLTLWPAPASAYIGGPPQTLGMMCSWSTHTVLVRVEQVIRDKNVIVFRKVRDLKGKWPAEVIKHVIGTPDRPYIL